VVRELVSRVNPAPDNRGDALQQLAELAGIETSFDDAWGKRQELSRQRIEALLAALGIAARDEIEVRAALAAQRESAWRRTVPPVLVQREQEPLAIPVVVAQARTRLAWRIEEEGGSLHQGQAALDAIDPRVHAARDGQRLVRAVLRPAIALPCGYHTLVVDPDGAALPGAVAKLIIVPDTCYLPPALARGGRTWGFATQLYGLRSPRNWGIGDFTDCLTLIESAHALGAGILGVNPLHAPFLARPQRASPYAASSRLFLNPLCLDVERVADFAECPAARARVASAAFQERLQQARVAPRVEYTAVAGCKLEILELLYASFVANHLRGAEERRRAPGHENSEDLDSEDSDSEGTAISARGRAFRRFQRERGAALRDYALFEALAHDPACAREVENFRTRWEASYKNPRAAGALAFARRAAERIEFYQYLQWLTDTQLEEVADRCRRLGLAVGLYLDLAVGVAQDGADVWADQDAYVAQATVGAPPDIWNPMGQDWGLPPLHPARLQAQAYAPFIQVLRANMRHAGALRIDHILALLRLYWIPGTAPSDGGYVRYPLDDLLGIVALESQRNRCLVIGEDLGTVPKALRARLEDCGILSYRLLYFEQDEHGNFLPPEAYPRLALATVTTHDLPTLPGYWAAHDLHVRGELDLFPSRGHEADSHAQRDRDRAALLDALRRADLWSDAESSARFGVELLEAVYRFLARSPAMVLMVHFEDILGEKEQANVPGTVDEHPNWQRKLPLDLAALLHHPRLLALARRLQEARPASDEAR
jgi:(1->4)-alpha-D-glucan 1-alpha-D-glucosylmutase